MVILMKLGVVRGVPTTATMGGREVEHGDSELEARKLGLEIRDVFTDMGRY